MIKQKTKDQLLNALKEECEDKLLETFEENMSEKIKLYCYNSKSTNESTDKIERRISIYENRIKKLKELKADWLFLNSKHARDMDYEEFIKRNMMYEYYNTTI